MIIAVMIFLNKILSKYDNNIIYLLLSILYYLKINLLKQGDQNSIVFNVYIHIFVS